MSTFAKKVMRLKAIWRKQKHEKQLKLWNGTPTTEDLMQQLAKD